MKSNGFTLIEILVTIAIVAVLSSVVIANVTQGRDVALNSAITSQVSEYKKAITAVKIDSGSYPQTSDWSSGVYDRLYCLGTDRCGFCTTPDCSTTNGVYNGNFSTRLISEIPSLPSITKVPISISGTNFIGGAYHCLVSDSVNSRCALVEILFAQKSRNTCRNSGLPVNQVISDGINSLCYVVLPAQRNEISDSHYNSLPANIKAFFY